jgi:hypothetical protein
MNKILVLTSLFVASLQNVSVVVGIPGQASVDNDIDAGAFLETVYSVKQYIFSNGFE